MSRPAVAALIAAALILIPACGDGGDGGSLRDWRERFFDPTGNTAARQKRDRESAARSPGGEPDSTAEHIGQETSAASRGPGQPAAPAQRRQLSADEIRTGQSGGGRVLFINDEMISVGDVLQPIRPSLEKAAANYTADDYYNHAGRLIRAQAITEVAERLVFREANRKIDEDLGKRIDAAVSNLENDRIREDFGGRTARYEAALAKDGLSRETVRQRLRRRLIVQQYIRERLMPQAAASRREVFEYYEKHRAEFSRPARVEMFLFDIPIRSLLSEREMKDANKTAAARRVARGRLEEARAKLAAGASCDQIAREYSRGLHAEKGGSWGLITEPLRGYWEEPSRTALAMKAGELSTVRDAPECVYLVRIGKAEPAETLTFDQAQPLIMEKVRQQKLNQLENDFLQSLLDRAAVGRIEPFIRAVIAAAPESGQGRAYRK